MKFTFVYHPFTFYLITLGISLALGPIAAYLSFRGQVGKIQSLLLFNLFVPAITALVMIYASGNKELIQDFWFRLMLFKIDLRYLMMILLLMPCVILLATAISLIFGYTTEQFLIAKELSVMKGWGFLGILIPLVLAPLIEEIGWRGYGVDSLRPFFSLFTTSLIFGILWALWHLPLFFVKGYYQNQLWGLGIIHVINFFVSVIVLAFLMNWVYYKTDRSIPAIILFHSMLNLSSIFLRTEPITKCLATVLLGIVLITLLFQDSQFFFRNHLEKRITSITARLHLSKKDNLNQSLQYELDLLRQEYHFPGATMSYVLANGKSGTVTTGLADLEKNTPMTNKSRMLAASIGKTFVAATIIALDKEGFLTLDDPLSKWLGKYPWYSRLPNSNTITLRHLLTHSSGLPNHVEMTEFVESFPNLQIKDAHLPELLIQYILDLPPLFEAGKGWSYTDTGYILLGLVIESATKNNYYEEVERRFLKPLNLNHTAPSNRQSLSFLVAGYTFENNFFGLPKKTLDNEGIMVWNPAVEWTGGGLISNSEDLARWAKLLYEEKAMPMNYLDDLFQSVPTKKHKSTISYGLGVVIEEKDPFGTRYGHGGVIPGYTSSMRYYLQHGISIAFQINTDHGISDYGAKLVSDMEHRLANILINYQNTI